MQGFWMALDLLLQVPPADDRDLQGKTSTLADGGRELPGQTLKPRVVGSCCDYCVLGKRWTERKGLLDLDADFFLNKQLAVSLQLSLNPNNMTGVAVSASDNVHAVLSLPAASVQVCSFIVQDASP